MDISMLFQLAKAQYIEYRPGVNDVGSGADGDDVEGEADDRCQRWRN